MKILFVCDTYYPHINGVYYFVCRIGPLLKERGHQVAVVAPSATMFFSETQVDGLKVYGIPSVPVFYYPGFRLPVAFLLKRKLKEIINSFDPDIIHLQDHFLIAAAMLDVNKNFSIPVMGTNHFMPENLTALFRREKIKKKLESYSWSRFSKVFNQLPVVTTPTETAAKLIRPRLHTKVVAISSGIDLQHFSPFGDTEPIRHKYGIPDKPVLLYVGRLDPEKHLEEVIQVMVSVIKKIDICLVIAGKGMERETLERLAQQLNVRESVIFTGFVPDEDLPLIYALSRCFVIASTAELLSLATLQAMGAGLPVVAADAGALPELVLDNVNGYLYKPGDLKRMADCISNVFICKSSYKNMCEHSRALALDHDIRNTVTSFENLYHRTISESAHIHINAVKFFTLK